MMEIPRHNTVNAWNERGQACEVALADERPLTVYVNDQEVVTLMTSGAYPEALAIGYLRNQRLQRCLDDMVAIEKEEAEEKTAIRVITRTPQKPLGELRALCGCGVGSTFSLACGNLPPFVPDEQKRFSRDALAALLAHVEKYEADDRKMGAVHTCALADQQSGEIIYFVEDVSRHNAVDTISGLMWEAGVSGENHVFYTTGRLTSEIALKIARMGIPVIVSRSMPSKAGCILAEKLNMTMIGRARQQQYLLFGNSRGFKNEP